MLRSPHEQNFSAEARSENIRLLRRTVAGIAAQAGADEQTVSDVTLCVDEALTNVVRHAYGRRPGPMYVAVRTSSSALEVVVRDEGRGVPERQAENRGLGLEIINRLTETYSIAPARDGGTAVRMRFALA